MVRFCPNFCIYFFISNSIVCIFAPMLSYSHKITIEPHVNNDNTTEIRLLDIANKTDYSLCPWNSRLLTSLPLFSPSFSPVFPLLSLWEQLILMCPVLQYRYSRDSVLSPQLYTLCISLQTAYSLSTLCLALLNLEFREQNGVFHGKEEPVSSNAKLSTSS